MEAETAVVAGFLGVAVPDPPMDVHLRIVEVAESAGLQEALAPNVGGVHAWTVGEREINVFVGSAGPGRIPIGAKASLRHELAHVFLRRMGIEAPPWFDEGLAHEVEDAVRTPDVLVLHPAPLQLVIARALAPGFDLAEVWRWDGRRTREDPEREAVLRAISQAIVRFLLEREGARPSQELLARLAVSDATGQAELEADWRRWIGAWDISARIESGLVEGVPEVRRASAKVLPELADLVLRLRERIPLLGNVVDARLDAIAARATHDPETCEAACRYLVFFRARDVAEEVVAALTASSIPEVRLAGLAVRVRRGGQVDQGDVVTSWDGMRNESRVRFGWLRQFLPLPVPR